MGYIKSCESSNCEVKVFGVKYMLLKIHSMFEGSNYLLRIMIKQSGLI